MFFFIICNKFFQTKLILFLIEIIAYKKLWFKNMQIALNEMVAVGNWAMVVTTSRTLITTS